MRSLQQLLDDRDGDLAGAKVLVRSDLNTPLTGADDVRTITDDGRIRASLATWEALLDAGAAVVVCAHLGRPKGAFEQKSSLAPVAARVAELLGDRTVVFAGGDGPTAEQAREAAGALSGGELLLLENLRFDPRETSKDDAERGALADELAALVAGPSGSPAFVSDGFGVLHRTQASVVDVVERLESATGLLVAGELEVLERLTHDPQRPYAVALGGSKVSDKLGVIDHLLSDLLVSGDALLVGGGMAFTFLAARGLGVGTSLLESDQVDTVRGYLDAAEQAGVRVLLPTDVVVASAFSADAAQGVVAADAIGDQQMGLDIGPEAAAAFAAALDGAGTVFWNGPMGAFEMAPYADGTKVLAQAVADATTAGALTVIGGGDSAAAVRQLGFEDSAFSHISTGGGASLEYLEGKTLPGLAALDR